MSKKRGISRREKRKREQGRRRPSRVDSPRKTQPPFTPPTPPWIDNEALSCPCGTGTAYKHCCKDFVPTELQLTVIPHDEENYVEAERAWRGALTKHIGYVVRHTLPLLKKVAYAELVLMDIKALDETAVNIASCLAKQGKAEAAIELFDHLILTVPLPGMAERMLALKAIWYDCKLNDLDKAQRLLAGVDCEHTTDATVLEVYLNVCHIESAFRKIKLVDRILKYTTEPSHLLQYSMLKALCLKITGDGESARRTINEAIQLHMPQDDEVDYYYLEQAARAIKTRWEFDGNANDLRRAIDLYNRLPLEELNLSGKAASYEEMAKLYSDSNNYDEAIRLYEETGRQHRLSEAGIIHFAEAYASCGRLEESQAVLSTLQEENISRICKLEYLQVKGLLALKRCDANAIREVVGSLQDLDESELYFQHIRDQLCIELLNVLEQGNLQAKQGFSANLGALLRMGRALARCIDIKPKFFGVGVNLNKLFEKREKDDAK